MKNLTKHLLLLISLGAILLLFAFFVEKADAATPTPTSKPFQCTDRRSEGFRWYNCFATTSCDTNWSYSGYNLTSCTDPYPVCCYYNPPATPTAAPTATPTPACKKVGVSCSTAECCSPLVCIGHYCVAPTPIPAQQGQQCSPGRTNCAAGLICANLDRNGYGKCASATPTPTPTKTPTPTLSVKINSVSSGPASGRYYANVDFTITWADKINIDYSLDCNNDGKADLSGFTTPNSSKIRDCHYNTADTYTVKVTVSTNRLTASDTNTFTIAPLPTPTLAHGVPTPTSAPSTKQLVWKQIDCSPLAIAPAPTSTPIISVPTVVPGSPTYTPAPISTPKLSINIDSVNPKKGLDPAILSVDVDFTVTWPSGDRPNISSSKINCGDSATFHPISSYNVKDDSQRNTVSYHTYEQCKYYAGGRYMISMRLSQGEITVSSNTMEVEVIAPIVDTCLASDCVEKGLICAKSLGYTCRQRQDPESNTKLCGCFLPPISTPTSTPTPVPLPGSTILALSLTLEGIEANRKLESNISLSPVTIEVFNATDKLVLTKTDKVVYQSKNGKFERKVDLGNNLPQGEYTIKIKIDNFLKKQVDDVFTVESTTTTQAIPVSTTPLSPLLAGDINNDGNINSLDYNVVLNCFGSKKNKSDCANKSADINHDGEVTGIDHNITIRNFNKIDD